MQRWAQAVWLQGCAEGGQHALGEGAAVAPLLATEWAVRPGTGMASPTVPALVAVGSEITVLLDGEQAQHSGPICAGSGWGLAGGPKSCVGQGGGLVWDSGFLWKLQAGMGGARQDVAWRWPCRVQVGPRSGLQRPRRWRSRLCMFWGCAVCGVGPAGSWSLCAPRADGPHPAAHSHLHQHQGASGLLLCSLRA